MAIKTQYPYINANGVEKENFIKTYSDIGLRILQNETGAVYDEAVDLYPSKYTYSETDEYIEEDQETDYRTAYNNLAQEVMKKSKKTS